MLDVSFLFLVVNVGRAGRTNLINMREGHQLYNVSEERNQSTLLLGLLLALVLAVPAAC